MPFMQSKAFPRVEYILGRLGILPPAWPNITVAKWFQLDGTCRGCSSKQQALTHVAKLVGLKSSSNHLAAEEPNGSSNERDYVPEGAKRRYPAHFVSKLTDSDGELQETRHWLGRALAYGYIAEPAFKEFEERCAKIGGMLGKMIQNPDNFT